MDDRHAVTTSNPDALLTEDIIVLRVNQIRDRSRDSLTSRKTPLAIRAGFELVDTFTTEHYVAAREVHFSSRCENA
eukprot:SAG11_NODE_5534_length_1533_cov_1.003487_2_plen_75_part_01